MHENERLKASLRSLEDEQGQRLSGSTQVRKSLKWLCLRFLLSNFRASHPCEDKSYLLVFLAHFHFLSIWRSLQVQQLRRMLQQKNEAVAGLRRRLEKYEPERDALQADDDDDE